jgi:hypothetical protein
MPRAENQEFPSYFATTVRDGHIEVKRPADEKRFAAVQESRQATHS